MITIIKNVNTAMQMFPWKKKVNVFNVPEKKMMENCYVCLLCRGHFTFENVTRKLIYHVHVIS